MLNSNASGSPIVADIPAKPGRIVTVARQRPGAVIWEVRNGFDPPCWFVHLRLPAPTRELGPIATIEAAVLLYSPASFVAACEIAA